MEYLKTYYSLERHLQETVNANPQFDILNAIWKLNKKNLTSALSNVGQYFPHYSLHEKSHSNTIIHNIESFLGEERIKRLSPTDTWLLLMASFTHDLGMVVFYDLVENSWLSSDFQEFLLEICEWDDEDMKASGELLIKFQRVSKEDDIKKFEWLTDTSPIAVKNAVTVVIAEYIRRVHHKRSADILKGVDKVFFEVANSFYSDQIPGRLLTILGEVAYLHGVKFYDIFERLDYQANGISSDKIHPRFIAAMLRLGDLLDIDDNRFNVFTENVFKFPKASQLHKEKHSSIKHFLVTPQAIEITADCPNESVYRLARDWFDWLEKEVENQSKEWSNITPLEIGGTSPQIPKGKIKVYYKGNKAPDELLNLRFQVSNEKIFQILEGASIYENAGLTFIRELIQNGLDASKIQLWREIENGTHDFAFREQWGNSSLSHEEIINRIAFPSDIPDYLMKSFIVKLNVSWENEDRENLMIVVEDYGTGISDDGLIRMTSKVGESRKKDGGFPEMLKRMPFWLKPTGAFGIGIQSVFIIVDSFKVDTRAEGESAKQIIFRSARKGKYSSWAPGDNSRIRGTKVTVSIPVDKFPEAFGTSFDWGLIGNYDYFTDNYGNIYIPKIRDYILKILSHVTALQVNFMGKDLLNEYRELNQPKFLNKTPFRFEDFEFQIVCHPEGLSFYANESTIGSEFSLFFISDIEIDIEENWPSYKTEFYVRDVPVDSSLINYYRLSYCKLLWNFMSPESDKILSLTREKFIDKYKRPLVEKFLSNLIPRFLIEIDNKFTENIEAIQTACEGSAERIALIYYKLLLTKAVNGISTSSFNQEVLGDFHMPTVMVSYFDGTPCKYIDLIRAESILVSLPVVYTSRNHRSDFISTEIKKLESSFNDNEILYKDLHFYTPYLRATYSIREAFYSQTMIIFRMQKTPLDANEAIVIKTGEEHYLKQFLSPSLRLNRRWNYSSSKYADRISVQNDYNTGFEDFPTLSRSSIISPFKNKESYIKLQEEVARYNNSREQMLNFLSDEKVKQYITPSLISWIIDHHSSSLKATEETIVESYRQLIADLLLLQNR